MAIDQIKADPLIGVKPVLIQDTSDLPGSPRIDTAILQKIDESKIFVGDVSIIGQVIGEFSSRPTVNPNVLFELGYALKTLTEARILLVKNVVFDLIDGSPFDIRQFRAIPYESKPTDTERAPERRKLAGILARSLLGIISEIKAEQAAATAQLIIANPPQIVMDEEWFTKQQNTASLSLLKTTIGLAFMQVEVTLAEPKTLFSHTELRGTLSSAVIKNRTGWPIGSSINDSAQPKPDGIVAETSRENLDWGYGPFDIYEHLALREDGSFQILRSLDEDARQDRRGKSIYFDLRIERIAETLLYCQKIYSRLGIDPHRELEIRITFEGLKNRSLGGNTGGAGLLIISRPMNQCVEQTATKSIRTNLEELQTKQPQLVKKIMQPIFRLFNFQEFDDSIYEKFVEEFHKGIQ